MGKFVLLFLACAAVNGDLWKDGITDITVNGEYFWELFVSIDNSENGGQVSREVEMHEKVSISYDSMVKTLNTGSMSDKTFDIIQISVMGDLDAGVKELYEGITKTRGEHTNSTLRTDTYEVGPNSTLTFYRLTFNAPGLSFLTSTVTTQPVDRAAVPIIFKVQSEADTVTTLN